MKTENKKTLRGSVLFTVICVMALLIIFLTGTLALASASNNRAHKSYSTSQASYTARAAIESFTEAMQKEPQIVAAIQNMTDTLYPQVIISDAAGGGQDRSLGVVGYYDDTNVWHENAIKVEQYNDGTQYAWVDDGTGGGAKWSAVDTVKITATARVGREEATVSAYIKKKGSSQITVPQVSKIKGLQTVGAGSFANGGQFTGGLGVGLSKSTPDTYLLNNAASTETTFTFINGDLIVKTSSFEVRVKSDGTTEPCSETVILGSLYMPNDPFITLTKDYGYLKDEADDRTYNQKTVPYAYVDGAIVTKSLKKLVVQSDDARDADLEQPFNLFAGTVYTMQNEIQALSGDLYLMDSYHGGYSVDDFYTVPTDGDPVTVRKGDTLYGTTGTSNLYKWVDNTVNGKSHNNTKQQFESYGGNIYCNGNITFGGSTNIAGDLRVMGDCVLKEGGKNLIVSGDIVVGGTLYIEGDSKVYAKKIYCDNVVKSTSGASGYTVQDNVYVEAKDTQLTGLTKVELPDRDLYQWNLDNHGTAGQLHTASGDITGQGGILYYRYNYDYNPDSVFYQNKNDGSVTCVKPYDSIDETEWEMMTEGSAPLTAKAVLESISQFDYDAETEPAKEYARVTFIDLYSGKRDYEIPHKYTSIKHDTWTEQRDDGPMTSYKVQVELIDVSTTGELITRETSIPADSDYMWYDPETNSLLDDGDTWLHEDGYYLRVDKDGNVTDERTGAAKSYYDAAGNLVSEYEATHSSSSDHGSTVTIEPYSNYGEPAYPQNMTREHIYGEFDASGKFVSKYPNDKIVKTLEEVRKEVDLDPDSGEFNVASYPQAVPADHNADANAYTDSNNSTTNSAVWSSLGHIKEDCTIKGALSQSITINPEGQTIWVVLDNVQMLDGKNIYVDLANPPGDAAAKQEGKVNFLIKGNLTLRGSSIVNKLIAKSDHETNPYKFDYTEDWGMEFFGVEGSKIECTNPCTLSGSFKCPSTSFGSKVQGAYKVDYTDEYNVNWLNKPANEKDITNSKPVLIGNALFKDILEAQNTFGLYYTESGQSGTGPGPGTGFSTALGYYELGYFSGS